MFMIALGALIYMGFEIYRLNDVYGDEYKRRALMQLINRQIGSEAAITPNRGSILDRNRQTLAYSSIVYDVFMDVRLMHNLVNAHTSESRRDAGRREQQRIIQATSQILGIPEYELWALLATNDDGSLVFNTNDRVFARQQSFETMQALEAARLRHIHTRQVTRRTYVYGSVAPQIIGFGWANNTIWRGVESRYNRDLSGVNGRVLRVYDSSGLGVVTERVPPQDGNTVILTIDLMIQHLAERAVLKYGMQHNAAYTATIVMNPFTGEVIAMAAYPSFDLNDPMNPLLVTSPALAEEWSMLPNNELAANFESIWRNFNITHTFEPGSVFKPITVAAALEEGIISINDRFFCGGSKIYAGHTMHCHRRTGHGWLNLREVNAYSCNVALMEIAERMGSNIFYRYQRDFGYGEPTGIDLPAEASASVLIHRLSALGPSELAASSFGQRFLCTPIQAITSFCAIINGGYLFQPYIVSQIVDSRNRVVFDRQPIVTRKVLSHETSDWMRDAMVDTFVYGTGARARIPGHAIGGKSGTAHQGTVDEPGFHIAASFIGYFPADNPQYVVMTIIYDPEGDTPSASHMFAELVTDIINHKRIPPTTQAARGTAALGDYIDMPVWQAAQILNRLGIDFQFVGNTGDTVIGQFPRPGDPVPTDGTVFLMIDRQGTEDLTEVPDVEGMTARQARTTLRDAGFVPVVTFANPSHNYEDLNRVYVQTPDPWQRVTAGMEVRLNVRIE